MDEIFRAPEALIMKSPPRICVIVPVYNHALTVLNVVRRAKRFLPVIAVNDGSTDATPVLLKSEDGITVVGLARNQGKAAALKAGFAMAEELGFTHAITIDADGQHPASALPDFVEACRGRPEAFISGVRDLKRAKAPWARRFTNELSTFWFRFETGVGLKDTQCGYRVYPLEALRQIHTRSDRYAYELEILVKAAWAGIPVVGQPVEADYAAPTSRLSHFRPFRDLLRISRLHAWLTFQSICLPPALRLLIVKGLLRRLPTGQRLRTVLVHLFNRRRNGPVLSES